MTIDCNLSMSKQVTAVCSTCIYTLCRLRRLAPLLSFSTVKSAVQATVISRLDYGNALYAGITSHLLHRLQTVQNDAARLIFRVPRHTRASPLFRQLHWLPTNQRVTF